MNKLRILVALCTIVTLDTYAAMDHSAHRGSSKPAMGGTSCVRPQMSKMQPGHLATVAPGAEFSFVVSNIDDPELVSVDVKRQAVDVIAEFKDPYYILRGKIPASLSNTAARINVKIDSKIATCRAEDGWLIKISEN